VTYRSEGARAIEDWKMGKKHQEQYAADPNVKHIHISFETTNWW
jgi:hypothetical protein